MPTKLTQDQVSSTDGATDLKSQLINMQNAIDGVLVGVPLKYVEMSYSTTTVTAGSSAIISMPFPSGVKGVLAKTIFVQSVTDGTVFTIDIQTANDGTGRMIYRSIESKNVIYDMVDLPYKDGMNSDKFHLNISNTGTGTVDSTFAIIVVGVSLI